MRTSPNDFVDLIRTVKSGAGSPGWRYPRLAAIFQEIYSYLVASTSKLDNKTKREYQLFLRILWTGFIKTTQAPMVWKE